MVDGNDLTGFEDIASAITSYYEGLFSQDLVSRPRIENLFEDHLPPDLSISLERHFTKEEIKAAVFSMDKDKSPGPDGFS